MDVEHILSVLAKGERLTVEFKQTASALPHLYANCESFPKNPHLAKFFVQLGRAEELGTGIRKIFKYSQLYSGDAPSMDEGDVFVVVVPLLTTTKATTKATTKTTTKLRVQLLGYLEGNPRSTARDLAVYLGLSEEGVRYHIKKLKANNQLTYKGSPRSGQWTVIKTTDNQ